MSHTPGPWKFEDEYVRDASGDIIADPYTMPTADSGDAMEANAILIAAAPDLLAACKSLISTLEECGVECLGMGLTRAAIAKATGQ